MGNKPGNACGNFLRQIAHSKMPAISYAKRNLIHVQQLNRRRRDKTAEWIMKLDHW